MRNSIKEFIARYGFSLPEYSFYDGAIDYIDNMRQPFASIKLY